MKEALCIQNCYFSEGGIYYEKGTVYQVDEAKFKDLGFLKYFKTTSELPPREAELVEAAAHGETPKGKKIRE